MHRPGEIGRASGMICLAATIVLATASPAGAGATGAGGSESDQAPPGLTAGFTFEPVAERAWRMVDDGAGHDASWVPRNTKWLMKLTTAPDGSVWLPHEDYLLAFGHPGVVENPIGPGALELEIEADGTLWIRNGSLARGDGTVLFDNHDVPYPRAREMSTHPHGGVVVAVQYADHNELRRITSDSAGPGEILSPPLPSEDPDWSLVAPTVSADGTAWAIEARPDFDEQLRRPYRLWRSDGAAWQLVRPLGERTDVEPVALEVTPAGTLVVQLRETDEAIDGTPDGLRPIRSAGQRSWLAVLQADGSWSVRTVGDGIPPTAWLVGASDEAAWFAHPTGRPCDGLFELAGAEVWQHLDGVCLDGVAVASDGTAWAVGRQPGARAGAAGPQLYAITPAGSEPEPAAP